MTNLKKAEILYEPLPIARIGVRRDNQEVIVANDFSCFAQMLEEYICFGAVHIILSNSSPEIASLNEMPLVLKKRIRVIEDHKEIETVNRILFELRKEFDVKINEENNFLHFPKNLSSQLVDGISLVHNDVKKLALGFNHNIQVSINTENSIESLRMLRSKVQNSSSRIILAQIEALLNQYKKVDIETINVPKDNTPYELVSVFDKLINDKNYLEYSNSITQLSSPLTREGAQVKIRELIRVIKAKNYFGYGWDYITKIINAWTGIHLPESKTISSIINGNEFPSFVNMDLARQKAVDLWKKSDLTSKPLRRDGLPVTDENIAWIPVLDGVTIRGLGHGTFNVGTVGELLKELEKLKREFKK